MEEADPLIISPSPIELIRDVSRKFSSQAVSLLYGVYSSLMKCSIISRVLGVFTLSSWNDSKYIKEKFRRWGSASGVPS